MPDVRTARRGSFVTLGRSSCPRWTEDGCECGAGHSPHGLGTFDLSDPSVLDLFPELAGLPQGVSRMHWPHGGQALTIRPKRKPR